MSGDFIYRGTVAELDPELQALIDREDRRQEETIILIPSESYACDAVNEALGSRFGNIYAEGYPREDSRRQTEAEILDIDAELAHYRRYSDPRYYKGVEYADLLEALTRRRAAALFAANGLQPDDLFVNVQPLSGAPANNAVYSALLEPGDRVMGLNLNDGGHLSHGSPVNRSGIVYRGVPYFVDPETEELDYGAIERLAREERPQIIVAGYSAYPLLIDWRRFRAIADQVGAYFLADIAHISGLVAAGVHPSPVGIADVVTTTTHKSLTGPRGAMILTHRPELARKLDRALFPGEQGGPHLNTIAALAVALKLAQGERFLALQQRIVDNAARLARRLKEHGLRVVAGRSENHLLLIDVKSAGTNGVHPGGDIAARLLDVAGIVTNRNTIPGDPSAFRATGVRLGTVWISQLGYGPAEIDLLAEAIATVLMNCHGFFYDVPGDRRRRRAKLDHAALQQARAIVAQLTGQTVRDGSRRPAYLAARAARQPERQALLLRGRLATGFLNQALAGDILALADGQRLATCLSKPGAGGGPGDTIPVVVQRLDRARYQLGLADAETAQAAAEWLEDLSDGYTRFADEYAKLPGPVVVAPIERPDSLVPPATVSDESGRLKPFAVGQPAASLPALPEFEWQPQADPASKRTSLYDTHLRLGARLVPFAGYEMPIWYSSVSEEHLAVRQAAGLFDVSHMGVFEARGPQAAEFLNLVMTNDINALGVGRSQYAFLLAPDGRVIDDLLVYRRGEDRFMLVVNAANNDEDWAWLNAVNEGRVRIDKDRPWVRWQHPAELRDLRQPAAGSDQRVDLALQGPQSLAILQALAGQDPLAGAIAELAWGELTEGRLAGCDVMISRTGYTGERVAFELFVAPESAPILWEALLQSGGPLGLKPCGLASRDSTRTEAGLPLHGHELAGPFGLNPAEAGFAAFVKLWKPFFVGRSAFMQTPRQRSVVRFRLQDKGVRRPEIGDPVVDRRGRIVGHVTSCALDSEGRLLGLAYVPADMSEPGTSLGIFPLGGGTRSLAIPAALAPGERLPVPALATILPRFPR